MPPRSILWGMLVANLCGVAVAILVAVVLSLDQPGGLLALSRAEVASGGCRRLQRRRGRHSAACQRPAQMTGRGAPSQPLHGRTRCHRRQAPGGALSAPPRV